MTRLLGVTFIFVIVFVFTGCGRHIEGYSLVNPAGSKGTVYETRDVRIEMSIVDDRFYGLRLGNKTDAPLRIFWNNSIAVNAHGREVSLDAVVVGSDGTRDGQAATLVNAGETVYAQAYPLENVYRDENGTSAHYPIYAVGDGDGSVSDLDGRSIGIKLVLDVNNRTRLIPLMLKVETSAQ